MMLGHRRCARRRCRPKRVAQTCFDTFDDVTAAQATTSTSISRGSGSYGIQLVAPIEPDQPIHAVFNLKDRYLKRFGIKAHKSLEHLSCDFSLLGKSNSFSLACPRHGNVRQSPCFS
jgi:hypothetical protein